MSPLTLTMISVTLWEGPKSIITVRDPPLTVTLRSVTIQLGLEPKGVAVSGDIFSLGVLLNEILYNYLVRCSKQGSIQRVRHVSKDTSSLSPVFA